MSRRVIRRAILAAAWLVVANQGLNTASIGRDKPRFPARTVTGQDAADGTCRNESVGMEGKSPCAQARRNGAKLPLHSVSLNPAGSASQEGPSLQRRWRAGIGRHWPYAGFSTDQCAGASVNHDAP
ncbi:hypothetical protein MRX96_020558 [Rhipicephalus microplus]